MDLSRFKKAPKNLDFKALVIFENDNYMVINKPPFVPSLDERTADRSISIHKLARETYGDVQLCHRLDKETSGALVIAKNPEAYRQMSGGNNPSDSKQKITRSDLNALPAARKDYILAHPELFEIID